MPKRSTLAFVALAFLLGAAVGPAIGPLSPDAGADRSPDPEAPPYSLSYGGSRCLADEVKPNGGWVHEVAVGYSYAITVNATIPHDRGETVAANVGQVVPGTYEIAFRTGDGGGNASKTPSAGCRVGTTVDLAASLPTEYERVDVTMDGRTVLAVENEDTAADLYRLPNPIGADGAANATG